ncbi:hypothetical protein CI109_104367 [Kwoniella shandongensis]|uniref:Uncharacterized protein n=1 Tax=Kwoniella shandongensis TaxID=1734106 RepID=A0AAJ8MY12_9TREE
MVADAETQLAQNPSLDTKHDAAGAKHPEASNDTKAGGNPQTGDRYEVAPEGAHSRLDRKDERNHGNALADAKRVEKLEEEAQAAHDEAIKHPTAIARAHGNEPSRGAKKDEEIIDDEEEELRKKDEAKKQSKEAHAHHKH